MARTDERTKSAAICETCGESVAVWVWPDGEIQPVGTSDPCACIDPQFSILGSDPHSDPSRHA